MAEPTDGAVVAGVDRNDRAERSREGLAGGFLSAVRRRAFVPGAKSGGSPAAPSSRSAYHFTASKAVLADEHDREGRGVGEHGVLRLA